MVLDPIPQSLPVHFFGSRPQPPTSPSACKSADFQRVQVSHTHSLPRFLSHTQILCMGCVRQGLYFIVTGLHYKKEKKKYVVVVVRDVVVCVLLLLYVCVEENSLLHTHAQQQQHTLQQQHEPPLQSG